VLLLLDLNKFKNAGYLNCTGPATVPPSVLFSVMLAFVPVKEVISVPLYFPPPAFESVPIKAPLAESWTVIVVAALVLVASTLS
jgi:hypothetical protein